MIDLVYVLAAEGGDGGGLGASLPAIIVAFGGVVTSLTTVWINSKKQASATSENKGHLDALTDQISSMAQQISALKTENAELKIKIQLIEGQKSLSTPTKKKKKSV